MKIKKFKHKKTGTVADQLLGGDHYAVRGVKLPKEIIEDSNDWEELDAKCVCNDPKTIYCGYCGNGEKPKDYEILSYYNPDALRGMEQDSGPDLIKSVKRLSDGEVFTIGDKLKCIDDIITITSFKQQHGSIVIWFGDEETWLNLDQARHYKKPLFTTEDNVEVFEGDHYYFIENTFTILGKFAHSEDIKNNVLKAHPFSTKEAAGEYILMNKPCLSLNDLVKDQGYYSSNIIRLKQLVKSKLEK